MLQGKGLHTHNYFTYSASLAHSLFFQAAEEVEHEHKPLPAQGLASQVSVAILMVMTLLQYMYTYMYVVDSKHRQKLIKLMVSKMDVTVA